MQIGFQGNPVTIQTAATNRATHGAMAVPAVPFLVGDTITGAGGATGIVTTVGDGYVDLEKITGTFNDGEAITGTGGGAATLTTVTKTAVADPEIDCHGYNALIIEHTISGSPTTGGYISLTLNTVPGTEGQAHPVATGTTQYGLNVKVANQTTSYLMIIRGLTSRVSVKLNYTDGIHTVKAIPCIL